MEIADEIKRLFISERRDIDDETFEKICEEAFINIVDNVENKYLFDGMEDEKINCAKRLLFGITTLIVESVRSRTKSNEIGFLLATYRWSQKKVNCFIKFYEEHMARITEILDSTGPRLPKLLDISWKLIYLVETPMIEKLNKPIYILTLKVMSICQKIEHISFNCTIVELEDILLQFKLMLKSAEKV